MIKRSLREEENFLEGIDKEGKDQFKNISKTITQ